MSEYVYGPAGRLQMSEKGIAALSFGETTTRKDDVMTYRQRVMALAEELGASVETGPEGFAYTIQVMAPVGHHWIEGGVHELVASHESDCGEPAELLWQDLWERMNYGVKKCNAETCESWMHDVTGCEWWDYEPEAT